MCGNGMRGLHMTRGIALNLSHDRAVRMLLLDLELMRYDNVNKNTSTKHLAAANNVIS